MGVHLLSRISNARMCLQRTATCPLGEVSSTIYENNGNKRHSESLLSRKNPANINTIKSKGEINMNKSTVKDFASMPLCIFASKSGSCRISKSDLHLAALLPSCLASKKAAFTLAEILISLGIIGIVAALTLPAIISNYKKSVIETSVKKFYTNINQAIIMSERENGDMHGWSRTAYYDDGASTWDTYFDKYVITIKRIKTRDGKNTIFVFPDGSGVMINASDFSWCVKADYLNDFTKHWESAQCMLFGFYPNYPVTEQDCVVENYRDKGVEPYIHGNSDCSKITDPEYLCNTGRRFYYAKALQISGWKFPKNCKIGH